MPDNTQVSDNPVIAADEIGGVKYQRVKVTWGPDSTAHDTSNSTPLPVNIISGVTGSTNVLSVPEDPFGTDADAAAVDGSISAKLRQIATSGIPVRVSDGTTDADVVATGGTYNGSVIHLASSAGELVDFGAPAELTASPSIGTASSAQYSSLHTTAYDILRCCQSKRQDWAHPWRKARLQA